MRTKYQINAWPQGPRLTTVNGKTTYNSVFSRDYTTQASALRAATQVHRMHPAAEIELVTYELQAIFWMQREAVTVQFCLDCNARLDWQDPDMYHCPRCGSEWHDDHFKAGAA